MSTRLGLYAPTAARPNRSADDSSATALLDAIGPVDGARVLLVGASTLDIMCAAIRHGADAVTTVRASDRPEAAGAEIAYVSANAAPACAFGGRADCLPARLMRALVPLGSLTIELDPAAIVPTTKALSLHGFAAIHPHSLADGRTLLLAERPPGTPAQA